MTMHAQHFHTLADVLMEFDPTTYTVSESEGAVVMFRIVNRITTAQTFSVQFTTSPGTATGNRSWDVMFSYIFIC